MTLERRSTTYNGQTYDRFISKSISSVEEIAKLADAIYGGNYFYGGVLDTGSELHAVFGQGPKHDIFKQVIQETIGKQGHISTCQISFDPEDSVITGFLYLRDPGENKEGIELNENDITVIERRKNRILALTQPIPQNAYSSHPLGIAVGWLEGYDNIIRYYYQPKEKTLMKRLK